MHTLIPGAVAVTDLTMLLFEGMWRDLRLRTKEKHNRPGKAGRCREDWGEQRKGVPLMP